MKVCLYLEGGGLLAQSGIGTALNLQKKALDKAGVEYTTDPDGDYDLIHINTIGPRSLLYAQKAKEAGKKAIMHAHTLDIDTRNSFRGSNAIMPAFKRYLKFFYNQADHIICPSSYAKKVLGTWGLKPGISAVSNGVDLDKYGFDQKRRDDYRRKYGLKGMVPFSVGHVFVRKGVESFVNVAKRFDNRFMWFGRVYSGLLVSSESIQKIVEKPPKNVTFTGYVDDIVAAYCAGDIFFFPSLAETQGIVILEAMACKRPVLIRDLPVFEDWLEEGHDCLKAKDDKGFAEKLGLLMDDAGLRKRLVKNASDTVKDHSLEKVGKRLKLTYEDVLKK